MNDGKGEGVSPDVKGRIPGVRFVAFLSFCLALAWCFTIFVGIRIDDLNQRVAAAQQQLDNLVKQQGRAIRLSSIGDDSYIVIGVVGDPSLEGVANDYIVVRNLKTIGQIDGDGNEVKDDVLVDAIRLSPWVRQGFICTKKGCEPPPEGKSLSDYLS